VARPRRVEAAVAPGGRGREHVVAGPVADGRNHKPGRLVPPAGMVPQRPGGRAGERDLDRIPTTAGAAVRPPTGANQSVRGGPDAPARLGGMLGRGVQLAEGPRVPAPARHGDRDKSVSRPVSAAASTKPGAGP
jgi:hypothetical protein